MWDVLTRFAVGLAACSALADPALARPDFDARVKLAERVEALAFNPDTFFQSKYGQPTITIAYTGDDYGWPVYSIAVFDGCYQEDPNPGHCRSALRARLVRSPESPGMRAPRQRGLSLVSKLFAQGKTSRKALRGALDEAGVEWKEADLRHCPAAMAVLARSANLEWVPTEISNPTPTDDIHLVLHADIVDVMFRQVGANRSSRYSGYRAEGSPAAWATEFAAAIEPCWVKPAAPPPWRR